MRSRLIKWLGEASSDGHSQEQQRLGHLETKMDLRTQNTILSHFLTPKCPSTLENRAIPNLFTVPDLQ